ncbi:MAG: hypothetical protein MRERV_32c051, partial [Mycoplasmataceae bacterium RV_VA103A]
MEGVEELTGELLIENYANVEEIKFEHWDKRKRGGKLKGRMTKITVSNCPKVKELNLNNNEISEIILEGDFLNLERLDLVDNTTFFIINVRFSFNLYLIFPFP